MDGAAAEGVVEEGAPEGCLRHESRASRYFCQQCENLEICERLKYRNSHRSVHWLYAVYLPPISKHLLTYESAPRTAASSDLSCFKK
eukprot:10314800-Alexandrium_andersonii.AAC.1